MQEAILEFPAGTLLVKEHDHSRKMFIIRQGKVRVFTTYHGQRITLAVLGEGEVFGELSFFDAEPRSASVEALTDITALVIDGNTATQQIASLPHWILPLLRTIFHRFREADRKITILQSMNEYQKKNFKTDNVAQTVYFELMRFIKALVMVYEKESAGKGFAESNRIYKELDDLLGARVLGLRVFWRLLKEYDFIENDKEETEGKVILHSELLKSFSDYLGSEVSNGSFLFLSHSAVAVLRRIVGHVYGPNQKPFDDENSPVQLDFQDLRVTNIPLYQEALVELESRKILQVSGESLSIQPSLAFKLYTYQSMIKAFDHTLINLD